MRFQAISSLRNVPAASACTSPKTPSSRFRENSAQRQRSRSGSRVKTLWICPSSTDWLAPHSAERIEDGRRAATQAAQARNAERHRRTGRPDAARIHRPFVKFGVRKFGVRHGKFANITPLIDPPFHLCPFLPPSTSRVDSRFNSLTHSFAHSLILRYMIDTATIRLTPRITAAEMMATAMLLPSSSF